MKLDKTSYYPPSPLGPEEDSEEEILEVATVSGEETEPEANEEEEEISEEESNHAADETPEDSGYESTPQEGSRAVSMIAQIISWVMVPFFMPVYGVLLAFHLSLLKYIPDSSKWGFVLVVALINIVVPSLLVLLLKRMGIVHDLGLNGRRERLIPYVITILCMLGTAWFAYAKGAPMWLVMFFVAGGAAGVFDTVVNFFWKISAHAAGTAGVVALLLRIMHSGYPEMNMIWWLLGAVCVWGLVGSARLWLGRHTLGQVLAGSAVGFCSVFFLTMI